MIRYILYGLFLLHIIACTRVDQLAGNKGSGSETPNSLSGLVLDSLGNSVAGANVLLVPEGFNPITDTLDSLLISSSNSQGEYSFKEISDGNYNILAGSQGSLVSALERDIFILQDSSGVVNLELQQSGTLSIYIKELNTNEGSYLIIPGTDISAEISGEDIKNGFVELENIPSTDYDSVLHVTDGGVLGNNVVDEVIEVNPGEIKIIGPYDRWADTIRVFINTSSTGANLNENVYEFPLLLKISNSNYSNLFDHSNGNDIRFSKSDGLTPINFEIENWDIEKKEVFIWIKLDTVFSNNNSVFIYLYSNRDSISSLSSPSNVFSPLNGFVGVWHLNESVTSNQNNYQDASGLENHGTVSVDSTLSKVNGISGFAQNFSGDSSYIKIEDHSSFSLPSYTLSAWIKPDRFPLLQNIVGQWGKGGEKLGSWRMFVFGDSSLGGSNYDGVDSANVNSSDKLITNDWQNVAVVYLGDTTGLNAKLYINGNKVTESTLRSVPQDSKYFIGIGGVEVMALDDYFRGEIDEVRVSNLPRTDSWLKLSYENQKIGSSMVTFR